MEGLYYPCSENKGADQLRTYCAADMPLCFRTCKKPVFSQRGSTINGVKYGSHFIAELDSIRFENVSDRLELSL